MTYTKKQFLEDVAKEARALRKRLTKKEAKQLDLNKFDPTHQQKCIYGLATGDCRSDRAIELITNCCQRFIHSEVLWKIVQEKENNRDNAFPVVPKHINGTKYEGGKDLKFVSAIETYIYLPEAKNANLIAFLKGERKDLVL